MFFIVLLLFITAHFYRATLCVSAVFAMACVYPSVCHVGALYPHSWRYRQTSFSARYPHHSSFLTPSASIHTQFQGEPLHRGHKIHREWGNFSIFDWNRRISRKRYETGPWLLWNVNAKS